ncbi:MAG: metal-dependent hydrolase [Kofleriaceae bacterium]
MDIPRRDVDFAFAGVPRDWAQDDAYETTFLNALSLLFPEGEQFFVRSVKQFATQITDPELAREVAGFIGQEAMHGREHRAFNDLLASHGYREVRRIEANLKGFLAFVRKILAPHSQLAATCALEHFTAMLAEALLRDARMHEPMDPSVRSLWLWHALEESEHKAVAFEVYRATGGGYWRRVWLMALATIVFFIAHGITHARLMVTRRILWKPWRWARGATRFFLYPAFFTRLVPAYLAYFKPGFHPNDRDTRALLGQWRERLFGAGGTLEARLVA